MILFGMEDWARRRAVKRPTQPPPAITIGRVGLVEWEGVVPFVCEVPLVCGVPLVLEVSSARSLVETFVDAIPLS
jgi:hypothetical protein